MDAQRDLADGIEMRGVVAPHPSPMATVIGASAGGQANSNPLRGDRSSYPSPPPIGTPVESIGGEGNDVVEDEDDSTLHSEVTQVLSASPAAWGSQTEERSFVAQAMTHVRQHELFSFRPAPRAKGKKHGTNCGAILSCLVIALMLAYMVSTVQRFAEGTASIRLTTTTAPDHDPANASMFPISLAMPNLHNKSYFTLLVQHRTIPVFGARRSVKRGVPMNFQQVTGASGAVLDLLSADLTEIPNLFGDCQTQACAYFRIKVYPCSESTRRPGDPPCAPFDEIEHIVNTNYLRLRMHMLEDGEQRTRILDISLKSAFSFRRQLRYHLLTSSTEPDFLRTFKMLTYREFQTAEDIFSIDRIPRLSEGDDTEMCKFDFELTGKRVHRITAPQTVLDLVGQWGALYGSVFGFLALFLVPYTAFTFYSKRPAWDNFDDGFTNTNRRESNVAAAMAAAKAVKRVASVKRISPGWTQDLNDSTAPSFAASAATAANGKVNTSTATVAEGDASSKNGSSEWNHLQNRHDKRGPLPNNTDNSHHQEEEDERAVVVDEM